jgi:polyhydroxyalkanoate synthase
MALLGYLAAIDKPLVHSHSLFVTALQADDNSALGLFATREAVELSRRHAKARGYMDGKELSHIFAWLRPTDLVWNYWINNYLLGKEPPSMDVLYWDNDSTRLPAGLHSDFLDIFVEDQFSQPGKLIVKGQPIDIQQIGMDFYCVGGDEDYLMPWKNCFDLPRSLNNHSTFVLSTSGHIQSILRPPGIANTAYYTNPDSKLDADSWLASAQKNKGSWWEHWGEWLTEREGSKKVATSKLGSEQHPALCPSPGQYVNE